MTDQMGLFGGGVPPVERTGMPTPPTQGGRCALFFALQPDSEDARHIHQRGVEVRRTLGLDAGQVLAADRLHVSLHGLGHFSSVPEEGIARARAVARALNAAPIEVVFDEILTYANGDRRPCVLVGGKSAPALKALHQALGMSLADAGLRVARDFHPHMTTAYVKAPLKPTAIDPLRWTGKRLCLIWSHVGYTRYEYVGEWLLGR